MVFSLRQMASSPTVSIKYKVCHLSLVYGVNGIFFYWVNKVFFLTFFSLLYSHYTFKSLLSLL